MNSSLNKIRLTHTRKVVFTTTYQLCDRFLQILLGRVNNSINRFKKDYSDLFLAFGVTHSHIIRNKICVTFHLQT